jgi:hypothetical protein
MRHRMAKVNRWPLLQGKGGRLDADDEAVTGAAPRLPECCLFWSLTWEIGELFAACGLSRRHNLGMIRAMSRAGLHGPPRVKTRRLSA